MDWHQGKLVVVAGLMAVAASSASAQEAQPKTDAKPEAKDDAVTITGQKQQNRIDRQSYDNKPVDNTGTAADALSKVPSVTVDANGNVALRGDTNVQILVDGKPSALLSGDNRAAALQAMSSGQIASVEVMPNAGAQYGSSGSGGIINLVTTKNRKPGASGTVVVAAGIDGRHNGTINGAWRKGDLGFTGSLGYRHDSRPGRRSTVLQRLGPDGQPVSITQSAGTADNIVDSLSATAGMDYAISDRDTVAFQAAYARRDFDGGLDIAFRDLDATRQAVRGYNRLSVLEGLQDDKSAAVTWSHTGDRDGETLKTDLRLSRGDGANSADNLTVYSPSLTAIDRRSNRLNTTSAVLSSDYGRVVGAGQLAAGVQIAYDSRGIVNQASGSGASVTPDSDFAFDQSLSAVYVTYQYPIGTRWTVLGGVRVEALDLETDMVSSGTAARITDTRVNPSLFATYVISPAAKLRFSYSRRLQRPSPYDLNPYVTYVDPQNVVAGNPALKPQETDSFEAGYEHSAGTGSYQLRLFYRSNDGVITNTSTFVTPEILLTTRGNLGRGDSIGTEFSANTKIGDKLLLSLSGDLSSITLTTPLAGERSIVSLNGRLNLDYAATSKDRIQFSYMAWGAQLSGQGHSEGAGNASLAWRHTLTPKLSTLVSLADPFATVRGRSVTDTATLHQEQAYRPRSRNLIVGLTWTLGSAK